MHPAFALIERRLSGLEKKVFRFEHALRLVLDRKLSDGELSWLVLSGISAGASAIHSGMERVLIDFIRILDGLVPSEGQSHQDIMDDASIQAKLKPTTIREL